MSAIDVDRLLDTLLEQRRNRAGLSATSLNVIGFIEDDERLLERLVERTNALASRHASRTVLLVGAHACSSQSVRAEGAEPDDTRLSRSEQIQLGVSGVAARELRSIVHDLIVPDVRTVLLWGADLADPRFEALAELAQTVVMFSSATDRGVEPLRELVRLRAQPAGTKIRDLAYLRLLPWQDTIALFFDDEELAKELSSISNVEIRCGTEPEAYYLAGWLASRLGWEPCGGHAFCNAEGAAISVDIKKKGAPRRIDRITLRSANCVFGASVQSGADDLLCLTVEGKKGRPQRCVPLHDLDMISLIERAIFNPPTAVYGETLDMVERLLEREQSR